MLKHSLPGFVIAASVTTASTAFAQCGWQIEITEDQLQSFETNDLLAVPFAGQQLFISSSVELNRGESFSVIRAWDGGNITSLELPVDFQFPTARQLVFFDGMIIASGYFGTEGEQGP